MMAKELLDLQIDQMYLLQEELSLRRKVMDLDLKLGLCTQEWYDRKCTMLECKRAVYQDLLEDYQMTQQTIAELEQKAIEELRQLNEAMGEVEDTSYEIVEKDEKEHFVLHSAEANNALDKEKPTKINKESGKPYLPGT